MASLATPTHNAEGESDQNQDQREGKAKQRQHSKNGPNRPHSRGCGNQNTRDIDNAERHDCKKDEYESAFANISGRLWAKFWHKTKDNGTGEPVGLRVRF